MTNILHEDKNDKTILIQLSAHHDNDHYCNKTLLTVAGFSPQNARVTCFETGGENETILLDDQEMDTLCVAWMAYRAEIKAEEERIDQEISDMLKKIRDHGFQIEEDEKSFTLLSEEYHIRIHSDPYADELQEALDRALLEVKEQETYEEAIQLAKEHGLEVKVISAYPDFDVWFSGKVEMARGRLELLETVKRVIAEREQQDA